MSNEEPIRCKTIIVGDSGVGKTSIIGRYINNYNPNEKSTIGASFTNKIDTINGKKIEFEIWDTAGQERFRSINSIFYQDAYICILVYDITNKASFESLKDYWYKSVKNQATEGIIFHVAGNKIDLFEEEEVDRKVVKDYCESIDSQFNFISALDNTYIDDLFKNVGEKFLKSELFKNLGDNNDKNKGKPLRLAPKKDNNNNPKKKKCCK